MIYVANIVRLLFSIYIILIFVRIIFAWLRPNMFNPIVRFVYRLTDPYLKLFAGLKFLRVGGLDFTPILAFYFLYLLQELSYRVLLTGYFSLNLLASLVIVLAFRFVYFIIFIFIVAVGLRFIFELINLRSNNILVRIIYSLSEPVVRPVRNALGFMHYSRFDVNVFVSLVILVFLRFLILPKLLGLITSLLKAAEKSAVPL
ncbi:MAG: YggT family protein [Spirochaetota bacterium]